MPASGDGTQLSRFAQRSGYRSDTINCDYFAGVRPVVSVCHESGAHRIIAHVIPFLSVALIAAQHLIEESALPKGILSFKATTFPRDELLESPDPPAKHKIIRARDEQMNVIRHNYVAPDGDVVLRVGTFRKYNERSRDWIAGEDWSAAMRAGGDEENRITRNNAVESWRSSGIASHPVAAARWAA